MSTASTMAPASKLKFDRSDRFIRELRRRVDEYFERTGRRRRDCPQMYFKTATVLAWFFSAYFLLLFVATSWWTIVPLTVVAGLGMAAIGFQLAHCVEEVCQEFGVQYAAHRTFWSALASHARWVNLMSHPVPSTT